MPTEPAERNTALIEQINRSIRNSINGVIPPRQNRATRRKRERAARTARRAQAREQTKTRTRGQLIEMYAAANRHK